jgi:hypothetical protein
VSDALRELLAVFTTEVDTSGLEKGNEKVEGFSSKLKELAFTVGEIFALEKLFEFVKGTAESVEALEVLSIRLGVTTDDIQKFQYAVKLTGGDIATANQGLTLFSKNIGESLTGGGGAQYFQKLGVSVKDATGEVKGTGEILGDVADGFGKLKSDGERVAVAMGLFGRSGAQLVPILKKGKEGIAEMSAELERNGGLIDERTIKSVAAAAEQMNALTFSSNGLKAEIVAALAPAIISIVHWLQDGASALRQFAEHTTLVQSTMAALVGLAVVATVVFGALNFEFLLIVAAIALMIVIFDDLYGWWNGKDSFFGRIVNKIGGIGASHALLDVLKGSLDDVKQAMTALSDPTKIAGMAVDVLASSFHALLDIVSATWHALVGVVDILGSVPSGGQAMGDAFGKMVDNLNNDNESFVQDITGNHDYGPKGRKMQAFPRGPDDGSSGESNEQAQSAQDNMSNADLAAQLQTHVLAVKAAVAQPVAHVHGGAWPQQTIHQQNETKITIHGVKNADETAEKTGAAVENAHANHADDFASMPGGA